MYVQLGARPIEEDYRKVGVWGKVVCSWKNSEFESAEQRGDEAIKPHFQPNSVIRAFLAVYMFNWVFGQLRKVVGRSLFGGRSCSWKSSEFESAEQREEKPNLALNPIQ